MARLDENDQVHLKDGDVIYYDTRPGISVRVVVNENTNGDAIGALIPALELCRGCEANDVDEPDNMPYCPRCLMDAQLHAVLARIVENVGDENVPVARVLEWDAENARGARIRCEQYIDLESSALDWVGAMSPDEFRDEFVSYISRSLPEYMRDAMMRKLP